MENMGKITIPRIDHVLFELSIKDKGCVLHMYSLGRGKQG